MIISANVSAIKSSVDVSKVPAAAVHESQKCLGSVIDLLLNKRRVNI